MSIAFKLENDDIIWIDAVTGYNQNMAGKVTSKPVEDGTKISDTVIRDPKSFSLNGIISNADFNFSRPTDAQFQSFVINQQTTDPVSVESNKQSPLTKFIPETVGAFIPESIPAVTFDATQKLPFAQMVQERLEEVHNAGESITILEFDGNVVQKTHTDLYIQSLSFTETPDTGDALEFSINLQKVVKVKLEFAAVSKASVPSYGSNVGAGSGGSTPADVSASSVTKETAKPAERRDSYLLKIGEGGADVIESIFGF